MDAPREGTAAAPGASAGPDDAPTREAAAAYADATGPEAAREADGGLAGEARPRIPRLVVRPEFCIRMRGSSCARCEAACPHGAISYGEGERPQVDFERCTGCGICFGVCDAFASTRVTLADLHARIRRIALSGRRCYLTCKENVFPGLEVDSNVIVLPCLSMLSPEFWTLLLAERIRLTVACDLDYCDGCERGGELGGMLFPRCIELAEERAGGQVLFSSRIPERQSIAEKAASPERVERREAFVGMLADLGEITSGKRRLRNSEVLQDYYERRERMRASARLNLASEDFTVRLGPNGLVSSLLFPKQALILETIDAAPEAAERIPARVVRVDAERCTGHGKCAEACPTGARRAVKGFLNRHYETEIKLCIGCDLCVGACPEGAISLEDADARAFLEGAQNGE